MTDKPEDAAKRAHAISRLGGGLIFKSQTEIDQQVIESAESPEDERFVEIAERVKAYLEEVGIEIRFAVRDFQLRYELNVDFNIAPRLWVAELLVVAWHSYERRRVDKPTVPRMKVGSSFADAPLNEIVRLRFVNNERPVIEYSIDSIETVVQVLASVRDGLLAHHEQDQLNRPTPSPKIKN